MLRPCSFTKSRSAILVFGLLTVCNGLALAQDPQPLPVSKGVYRLPYADGTSVTFSNDHLNHPTTLNRIDMFGNGTGPFTVVSAGEGWVRLLVENNDTKCPDACGAANDCNGNGITTAAENQQAQQQACGNYTGPSTFCCERNFQANGGTCPGTGTCLNNPNNFVWIEHTNGEWTKYTHMLRGSIGPGTDVNGDPGAGRFVGEFVAAGTPLGIQGDVGIASGPHVHFEVAVPNFVALPPPSTSGDPTSPAATIANWFDGGGFLVGDGTMEDVDGDGSDDVNLQNRIAVFCEAGFPTDGGSATANPCNDSCSAFPLPLGGTVTTGNVSNRQFADTIESSDLGFVVESFGGVMVKAGTRITLLPGFHAEEDSYFSASIGGCDTPGGTGE